LSGEITTVITSIITQFLDELKTQYKSGKLLVKIYEQGKADGLPNDKIRELVVSVLRDVMHLGDRKIRRLLPDELKWKYNPNPMCCMCISIHPRATYYY